MQNRRERAPPSVRRKWVPAQTASMPTAIKPIPNSIILRYPHLSVKGPLTSTQNPGKLHNRNNVCDGGQGNSQATAQSRGKGIGRIACRYLAAACCPRQALSDGRVFGQVKQKRLEQCLRSVRIGMCRSWCANRFSEIPNAHRKWLASDSANSHIPYCSDGNESVLERVRFRAMSRSSSGLSMVSMVLICLRLQWHMNSTPAMTELSGRIVGEVCLQPCVRKIRFPYALTKRRHLPDECFQNPKALNHPPRAWLAKTDRPRLPPCLCLSKKMLRENGRPDLFRPFIIKG